MISEYCTGIIAAKHCRRPGGGDVPAAVAGAARAGRGAGAGGAGAAAGRRAAPGCLAGPRGARAAARRHRARAVLRRTRLHQPLPHSHAGTHVDGQRQ